VFVASRDDDADYRNAVAQNASLHVVLPQETLFTLKPPAIRRVRNLLDLKLATRSPPRASLRPITARAVDRVLTGNLHRLMHLAITCSTMLSCSMGSFAILLAMCADFLRVIHQKIISAKHPSAAPQNLFRTGYVGRQCDVLGFPINPLPSRPICPVNQGRSPRERHILLQLPIDSVMSFLSTTCGVVPVDSDRKRS
jgi:hypothetical protein